MIRDWIVVGLLDDAISEKLQLDARLTLETAVTIARQSEEVHRQQIVVRGKPTDLNSDLVDAVHASKGVDRKKIANKGGDHKTSGQSSGQQRQQKCTRCGKTPSHRRQQCPARDAICHCCHKKGHYQSMCRTIPRQVQTITSEASEEQFLGEITDSNGCNVWNVTVLLNGNEC